MKKYKIKFNNKLYEIEVEELPADYKIEDKTVNKVENINEKHNRTNAFDGTIVKAPMPGKILDIKVENGSKIKKGQPLVILEAMKLENEIVSPIDGTVISVNVVKGDSVELEASLITLQ